MNSEHPLLSLLPNASSLHLSPFGIIRLLYHVYSIRGAMHDKILVLYVGSDRNFGSVRGSADFGRFGSVKILPNFCRIFCHSISCSLTIYGYKADRL